MILENVGGKRGVMVWKVKRNFDFFNFVVDRGQFC